MSARDVTDPGAVGRSIAECDRLGREAFGSRYGFARSTRYLLRHEGREYDPAPIVAVAHREQHGRVLARTEVRGAQRVLRALGFEVIELVPPWTEDELVLALDVYLRHHGQRLGKGHAVVRELSQTLRKLGPAQGETQRSASRNPGRVLEAIDAFGVLDPRGGGEGKGGTEPSALHREVWDRYAKRTRPRGRRVAGVLNLLDAVPRSGQRAPDPVVEAGGRPPTPGERAAVLAAERGTREVELKARPKVSADQLLGELVPRPSRPRGRAKARWVDPERFDEANETHEAVRIGLATELQVGGFSVHQGKEDDLLFDLAATIGGLRAIVEVKSLPERGEEAQLRLGLGQILWYRDRWQERTDDVCVAVLCVERQPTRVKEWLKLCDSVRVVLTWPERFNILVAECERLLEVRRPKYRG